MTIITPPPHGFDRDGLRTGPTWVYCPECGVGPKQDHAPECSKWHVKPKPIWEQKQHEPDGR